MMSGNRESTLQTENDTDSSKSLESTKKFKKN
jgi:hypothetical protein